MASLQQQVEQWMDQEVILQAEVPRKIPPPELTPSLPPTHLFYFCKIGQDKMNGFFIWKIHKLRYGLSPSSSTLSHSDGLQAGDSEVTYFLKPSSLEEGIGAIRTLNQTGATGIDGIAVSIAAPVIMLPVAHLIALSFLSAWVPAAFKDAIVVPIHKGKSKTTCFPSSHHPVDILPTLSKGAREGGLVPVVTSPWGQASSMPIQVL